MKKLILVAIMFLAAASAAMGQSVRADDNRRTILNECVTMSSVVTGFAQYANQNSLIGYTEKTAAELGWTYVWNEVSAGKVCKTMLKPDAKVWVVNGEANPLQGYLNDCYHPTIKSFKNRVIVIEKPIVPVVTQTPVPQEPVCANAPGLTIRQAQELGYTVDSQRNCNKQPEVQTKTEYVDKPVATCPTNLTVVGKVTWKDRLTGQWLQKAISFGGSALGSTLNGQNVKGAMLDGAKGVALQVGQQAINAPEGMILLSGAGLNNEKIKRGEDKSFSNGLSVKWNGDTAVIFNQVLGQNWACYGYSLKETSNLGIWITGRELQDVVNNLPGTKTTPVKGSSVPVPPLQPGTTNTTRNTRVTRNGWTVQ